MTKLRTVAIPDADNSALQSVESPAPRGECIVTGAYKRTEDGNGVTQHIAFWDLPCLDLGKAVAPWFYSRYHGGQSTQ